MDSYDVWAIAADGRELLIYAVGHDDPRAADAHVTATRQWATATATAPEGLVFGNWASARRDLLDRAGSLSANIIDLDVPAGRTITRVVTLATAAHAAGVVPDDLVAAQTARSAPRPRKRATRATPPPRSRPSRPAAASARPAASPRRAAKAAEDDMVPCRQCFMLRRPDQLEDGVCADGCL